jgi:hypothetical protein
MQEVSENYFRAGVWFEIFSLAGHDSLASRQFRKEDVSMPNPIVHFEITGKSRDVLEGFYTAVFDWKITPAMPGYSLVDTGSGIGGGIGTPSEGHMKGVIQGPK